MFARPQRLTQKKLFERIFRRGTWVRGKNFSLRALPSFGQEGQIGFVISKKVTKSAQQRNRIKRQLRSAFKSLLHESSNDLLKRHYLLVVVHSIPQPAQFAQIVKEAKGLLARVAKG